jgi:hypothetical protein
MKDEAALPPVCDHCDRLRAAISAVRMQMTRIDDELVGSYGEIEHLSVRELRRILGNIANIVKP